MPRKLELTFQKGATGRSGRWKKFYRGKTHYLGNGNSKSDVVSYQVALSKWKKLKVQLDAERVSPPTATERDYETVLREWELVLSWSVQHEEDEEATIAREKIAELRERRKRKQPPPITHDDRLWSRFRFDPDVLRQIGDSVGESMQKGKWDDWKGFEESMLATARQPRTEQSPTPVASIGADPLRQQEIIWEDRLKSQERIANGEADRTLESWSERFLQRQQQRVRAGELSAGRFGATQATIEYFCDWAGRKLDVSSISSQTLSDYHAALLKLIASESCSRSYARDRMASARSFIRWLWEHEALESLPKNIDSNDLRIARQTRTPATLDLSEVAMILDVATERTRLYVLLALNCGMTQKDISDMRKDDVCWKSGRITRKRSKTEKHERVPIVSYKLWPETLELLREFRSDSDVVLLNRNGGQLVCEQVGETAKYTKVDNVRNAYERLLRKVRFSKPFKLLRKTSSTLINAEERFRGLDRLFLGHAPSSIAERHYSATTETTLDNALEFLREKYRIAAAGSGGACE